MDRSFAMDLSSGGRFDCSRASGLSVAPHHRTMMSYLRADSPAEAHWCNDCNDITSLALDAD